LHKVFNYVVRHWAERFGATYPHLRILERETRSARTRDEAIVDARAESVEQLTAIFATRSRHLLDEMRNLIDLLLLPRPGASQTDEYREIVISAMRERRRVLRQCLDDCDQLRLRAAACSLPAALCQRIDALAEEASSLEAAAIRYGLEDDEFVDAETESE
jgi:hypothetical protein